MTELLTFEQRNEIQDEFKNIQKAISKLMANEELKDCLDFVYSELGIGTNVTIEEDEIGDYFNKIITELDYLSVEVENSTEGDTDAITQSEMEAEWRSDYYASQL